MERILRFDDVSVTRGKRRFYIILIGRSIKAKIGRF